MGGRDLFDQSGETARQRFGGDWTKQKLGMLKEYLHRYTTALKKQRFQLAYVDAFAGTGYRELKEEGDQGRLLFEEIAQDEPQKFLEGSARIALKITPAFDRYVFVEKHRERFAELEKLKGEFSAAAKAIHLHQGEANEFLGDYCATTDWNMWRAVVFLDPFGMQIDWTTMVAIARTQAIDLWILFPLGMAVNRLLARDPEKIPLGRRVRLNRMFGSDDWFGAFYRETTSVGLLGADTKIEKACTFETISDYYHGKLKSIFPKVAPNPRVLRNSTNTPLYQLFFAAANPWVGGDIALRIAQHILKER